MKQLIADFTAHLADALEHIKKASFTPAENPIHNVLILGLGGSGIGGSTIAGMAMPNAKVPIALSKNYSIPGFVNENTLVIACSYSGNTEETLTAVISALEKNAMVVCVTSGGELKEIARRNKLNCIGMQGGNPPRSMFAYPFTYLPFILDFYKVAAFDYQNNITEAINLLNVEEADIRKQASKMAELLKGRIVQLLAVDTTVGVAARFRQQLNENAKMLAWQAEIPEMNHNELVGWEGGDNRFAAVFLRNSTDFKRNQKRIEIVKDIIAGKTDTVLELWSKGESDLARAAYLVHFGDWVSYYLSELNEVDIIDIKSIDLLKSELGKVPFE